MPKIVLQAGHENIKFNIIPELQGSTGAPNEVGFNVDIRNQVAGELTKRGFEVVGTDANANNDPSITKKDFDGFVAIHYEADVHGMGGGFVDFCDPAADAVTTESQRIAKALSDEYFKTTGIKIHNEWSNANTRKYYMWRYLTDKTPCVLIECGVGMHAPDDHQMLHFNRPKVVEGITRGLCKAFNVPYDLPVVQVPIVPDSVTVAQGSPTTTAQVNSLIEQAKEDAVLKAADEFVAKVKSIYGR